eukprot:c9990_g1_i1.p1 GENE.c9990_g1_i1~~c9990_g1_i1.p1  ORF type:complete len:1115 (+),score=381.76 c9990_g1_i1:489-3347(+)
MENQCLNKIMASQRPDVERKRVGLIQAQGDLAVKLRRLEKTLLTVLSASSGNILEDDRLLNTLEQLKVESSEIKSATAENEKIMEVVNETLDVYSPLATAMRLTYFVLEQLSFVHFLYHFSLDAFLHVFDRVLKYKCPTHQDPRQRLQLLTEVLFREVFLWFSRSLSQEDHVLLGFRLSLNYLSLMKVVVDENVKRFILTGSGPGAAPTITDEIHQISKSLNLDPSQTRALSILCTIPPFDALKTHIISHTKVWQDLIDATFPEQNIPMDWVSGGVSGSDMQSLIAGAIIRLAIVKVLRPDRVVSATRALVSIALGDQVLIEASQLDFKTLVKEEGECTRPFLIAAEQGQDFSYKVEQLANQTNTSLRSFAMGTEEAAEQAEKAIIQASKSGTWVMLKNIHLDSNYLSQLSKNLIRLKPHERFVLFLTSEVSPKLPVPLLHLCRLLMFEKPIGVKANLLRTLTDIDASRMDSYPTERPKVYFLMAWLHAVVQERIRYKPIGWTKGFEFGESDRTAALDVVDRWLALKAAGRQHLGPDRIPWQAIRTLIGQSIYGGRVDNEYDQILLDSFLSRFLQPGAFGANFPLSSPTTVEGSSKEEAAIKMPNASSYVDFVTFVRNLPDNEDPTWLGLPLFAERMLLTWRGENMIGKILKSQSTPDAASGSSKTTPAKGTAAPQQTKAVWFITLQPMLSQYLQSLPKSVTVATASGKNDSANPMFRCFARESTAFSELLRITRSRFETLQEIGTKQANTTAPQRELIATIIKQSVPKEMRRYVFAEMSLSEWIVDLNERLQSMENVVKAAPSFRKSEGVWVGGLMAPEAWATATRQNVAQTKKVSVGDLEMVMDMGDTTAAPDAFTVKGLVMEGAKFENGHLVPATTISCPLPPSRIRWITPQEAHQLHTEDMLRIPVYLNNSRKELVFSCLVAASKDVPQSTWFQRGIALILWDKKAVI